MMRYDSEWLHQELSIVVCVCDCICRHLGISYFREDYQNFDKDLNNLKGSITMLL